MAESLLDIALIKPTNRRQIAQWVKAFLGFEIHDHVTCKPRTPEEAVQWERLGKRPHTSQLDYVAGAFLDEFSGCVFMAARNAGKSYAAAIVCLLECWFKPGIKIAVCGYVARQGGYIKTYLVDFIETLEKRLGKKVLATKQSGVKKKTWLVETIEFVNGSTVTFFSGGKSEAGVKGYHPNVMICDEADQYTQDQFDGLANALEAGSTFAPRIDVLSTNYTVSGDGVILKQIERYEEYNRVLNPALKPRRVFRTCLLDILKKCDDRFECDKCALWKHCRGSAKNNGGFYPIEHALSTMGNSSLPVFESQMLLLRPSSEFSYFNNFSVGDNVCDPEVAFDPMKLSLVAFDFGGGRCAHAALLVQKDPPLLDPTTRRPLKNDPGTYWVIDEWESWGNLEGMCDQMVKDYPSILDSDCFYDPSGSKVQHSQNAMSYVAVLRQQGYFPRCRELKRRPTFEQLAALITPASGPPRLKINKRCKKLILQIQAAEHKLHKGKITEEPSSEQHPDDHLDCCRYVVGNTWGSYAKKNGSKKLIWW